MNGLSSPVVESEDTLQAIVIRHLIDVHPATLARSDLLREFGHPRDGASQDEIEQAIRELAKQGLLEEDGKRVHPSRAVIRYHELARRMG